jgi:hypothetical protein
MQSYFRLAIEVATPVTRCMSYCFRKGPCWKTASLTPPPSLASCCARWVVRCRSVCASAVEFGLRELSTATAALGMALVVMSLYGGTAFLIEDLKQRPVLPLGRRGQARSAMQGSLADQLRTVPNETGVRQQL